MWISFLELVNRLKNQEFACLSGIDLALDELRDRRSSIISSELEQGLGHLGRHRFHAGKRTCHIAKRLLEVLLDPGSKRNEPGVPFPAIIDLCKSPMVQFVEHEKAQLQGGSARTPVK